jgi:hypothetical protein
MSRGADFLHKRFSVLVEVNPRRERNAHGQRDWKRAGNTDSYS